MRLWFLSLFTFLAMYVVGPKGKINISLWLDGISFGECQCEFSAVICLCCCRCLFVATFPRKLAVWLLRHAGILAFWHSPGIQPLSPPFQTQPQPHMQFSLSLPATLSVSPGPFLYLTGFCVNRPWLRLIAVQVDRCSPYLTGETLQALPRPIGFV